MGWHRDWGPGVTKVIGLVGISAMRDVMCTVHRVVERGGQAAWVPGCVLVSGWQGAHQRDGRGWHWMCKGGP